MYLLLQVDQEQNVGASEMLESCRRLGLGAWGFIWCHDCHLIRLIHEWNGRHPICECLFDGDLQNPRRGLVRLTNASQFRLLRFG